MCLQASAQTSPDEKLFQEAKVLLFDENWEAAQAKLEELLEEHSRSPLVPQAVFYRAKCLSKQRGKQKEALDAYESFLLSRDKNPSLVEEAETSIIDLSYDLYLDGDRAYRDKIEERLDSPNRVIRYFAALKLSQVKDKRTAALAIPVLKQIAEEEKDPDLRDRAKIALMRISPGSLRDVEDRQEDGKAWVLKIRVVIKGQKEPELSINIPWALADLALQAIPADARASLRKQGYDLDRIISQLTRTRAGIEIFDEGTMIKIWIDQRP
jgi:hypothetical protein